MSIADGLVPCGVAAVVYATKQGFNPKTQALKWSDLELVGQTGRIPTSTRTPVEINAPGRTGHHVLYTVWQASHLDQSYYACSDVNFTDGGTTTMTATPRRAARPPSRPRRA
ncbi:lytic polysaccharide monooxygenase [Lentzea sp. CC55]|uniref:lytic polysaccharide monooxygenase n=1 Tax=Lentzea sp. CC55 TaxID=2884909 RepID=UPI001F1BF490|nr:lytic polysaccharide monooxygenase [Lentzea sp. CC55]MCG8925539.1 lytic polysaccharide monooxygenase [Lentzea sp. CC55]